MHLMDAGDELCRPFGPVGVEAIPDQHARPFQLLVQMAEEADNSSSPKKRAQNDNADEFFRNLFSSACACCSAGL
jgi:hypothetical protein